MSPRENQSRLYARDLFARGATLSAILLGAFMLRVVDPASMISLPFRASCGALTGLPCIFCGGTRAMHHLLKGNYAQALYFNWLVFPLALLALSFAAKMGAEFVLRRRLLLPLPAFRMTPRLAALSALAFFGLWVLQVALALGLHKHELLNPSGALYPLLVR